MATQFIGKEAHEQAIRDLVQIVATLRATGSIAATQLGAEYSFTYLLTKRQIEAIEKVCSAHSWTLPFCKGIEINASTVNHILDSRLKDGVTSDFVAEVMIAAYNQFAEIHVNKNYLPSNKNNNNQHNRTGEQAIFLNGIRKLSWRGAPWHAVAIVALDNIVEGEKRISCITAYHADEKKIRGIRKG